jgi:hypothetical protein
MCCPGSADRADRADNADNADNADGTYGTGIARVWPNAGRSCEA